MISFLKRRLLNEKGATENILVVFLLIIIGVGAVIGFSTWANNETDTMKESTSNKIETTLQDASN